MTAGSPFLSDVPAAQALAAWRDACAAAGCPARLPAIRIPIGEGVGRVTAEAVWARRSSPAYDSAAMDGIAVRATDTAAATETNPVLIAPGDFEVVDTGDPMPAGYDAVVMREHVHLTASGQAELREAVPPYQHVRSIGEDISANELLLPEGHRLRPVDVAAAAAAGAVEVAVRAAPRVVIIPTGDEIRPIGAELKRGEILDTNSMMLAAQAREVGCEARVTAIVPDDPERLTAALVGAAGEADLVIVVAGSSAGRDDYTARVVEAAGTLAVHGVAVRPGHPVVLGTVNGPTDTAPPVPGAVPGPLAGAVPGSVPGFDADLASGPDSGAVPGSVPGAVPGPVPGVDSGSVSGAVPRVRYRPAGTPVLGAPGYPVSAALTFDIFAAPLLASLEGAAPRERATTRARLARKLASAIGTDDWVRVRLGQVEGEVVATPLPRGAGVLTSLVRADGLLVVPAGLEGHHAGEVVDIELLRGLGEVGRTIVAIGSHDLVLDVAASALRAADPMVSLASSNVGSLGGLVAVRDGLCHLAGSHLLDPASGDYTLPYVDRLLAGGPEIAVVRLVHREQGLLVAPGNPAGLTGLDDLARPGLRYVNRQRGAGTRALLDFELEQRGIDPDKITGYSREEYTHLAVAAAVAAGRADTGLGIQAAAQAFGLDFLPVAWEPYDLVLRTKVLEDDLLAPLWALLAQPEFQAKVERLGGYSCREMGRRIR